MAATAHQDWTRPPYPVQASFPGSTSMSQATTPVEEVDRPSLDQLLEKSQDTEYSASWHRAVTSGRGTPCPSTPQLRDNGGILSYQQMDTFQALDAASSTAASLSHQSTSPPPESLDKQSQAGSQGQNSPSWTSASVSVTGDEDGQIAIPAAASDLKHVVTRTLRRIPKSLRIESPIHLTKEQQGPPSPPPTAKVQSAPTAGKASWTRRGYPLQLATSDLDTKLPLSPPITGQPQAAHAESFNQTDSEVEAPPHGDADDQLVKPPQPSEEALATSSSSAQSSKRDTQSPQQKAESKSPDTSQTGKAKKLWHRRGYPLQAPASTMNLRVAPNTPPLSDSDNEDEREKPETESPKPVQAEKPKKSWQRRAYPLQAPASSSDLRPGSATPPDSENENESSDEPTRTHQGIKRWRRRRYPLHTPISDADLRRASAQDKPKSKTEGGSGTEHEQTRSVSTKEGKQNTSRPLSLTITTSKPVNRELPDVKEETEEPVAGVHVFRRSVYPRQSPAMIPNLEPPKSLLPLPLPTHQPSAVEETSAEETSKEETSKGDDEAAKKQAREKELIIRVAEQWRRLTYPVQSPDFEKAPRRLPPGNETDEDAEEHSKEHSILLPRNIQAIKNSESPPSKGRTIVVCLDGTGDKFDADNSNIVHIVSALKKDDPQQVTYYQAGIGTYSAGGLSNGLSAMSDMAVGSGLGLHVRDAYHFVMHTYKEGDRICIFGFSRGAYTARCLAGMIHKVGLLPPRNIQQIPFAYEFYKDDTPAGWKNSADFKKTFSIDICVHFLGCFDSVASVGFIPRQLPLSSTPNNQPRYFRHAMALDERRAKFKVCRHQTKSWDQIEEDHPKPNVIERSLLTRLYNLLPTRKTQDDAPPGLSNNNPSGKAIHAGVSEEEYRYLTNHETSFQTDVLEVWFAGAHADVGGGAVANVERHKLAQIPLRWMIRQAFECDTGIIFKTEVLAEFGLDVHTLWPKYKRLSTPSHGPPPSYLDKYSTELPPRSVRTSKLKPADENTHENPEDYFHLTSHRDEDWTPEQVEDFYDAMSIVNDQLIQAPTWWILEFTPVQYKVPTAPGQVMIRTGMNWGQYRGVDDYEPNLHWTVLQRMQHTDYKIRARTAPHTKWNAVA